MKIITDIFMYIFEALLLLHYADNLFKPRVSKFKRVVIIFAINIFLLLVYQLNETHINAIILIISYTLIIKLLYKSTFMIALFHAVIFISVMFSSEIFVMAISNILYGDFNSLNNRYSAYLFVVITSKLLYFTIIMIILKLFAIKENNETSNKYFWMLFIMPLSSILMLLVIRYFAYEVNISDTINLLLNISAIITLFANIVVFLIYEKSLKNAKELYNLKTIQQQEEINEKYFQIIEQSNKDMKIFSHDIKNHLTQIRNIDNINDVYEYIDKLMPNINKFTYTGISKNKMLDLIFSKYYTLCERKGISFKIDSKTANLCYIDDIDLSTLMNNLLDNAVEAAEKSSKKFIEIYIFSKNEFFDGLIIKNSCDSKPISKNDKLKTTKLNSNDHGIGLTSVKRILKKYDSLYNWNYIENAKTFETSIVFSKKLQ